MPECQRTPCSKQAQYRKFKWLQWDSSQQPISSESNLVIDRFTDNKIKVNPDKFPVIALNKKKSNTANIKINFQDYVISPVPSVE